MRLRNFVFIILLASLIACSSAKKVSISTTDDDLFPKWKTGLELIQLDGNLESNLDGEINSARFRMIISKTDSLSLTLYGPLGIVVGRLYSNPDFFLFFNTFTSEAFEGTPNSEVFSKLIFVPFSFNELVRLIRAEPPTEPDKYKFDERYNQENFRIFANLDLPEFNEFLLFNSETVGLAQYQRKSKQGKTVLNSFYSNYVQVDGFLLAKNILFHFPEHNGSLNLEIKEIKINPEIKRPFSFVVPDNIQRYRVE